MSALDSFKSLIDENGLWEKPLEIERQKFLSVEGARDTNFYFVLQGSFRIFFIDDDVEHTIRLGYRNNFIGALDAFLTNRPSKLFIQALKKSRVLPLKKERLRSLIASSPEMGMLWSQILEGLIYEQIEREQDILISSPQLRYERVFARSPQLFQEIPAKFIAAYLRMSPETLSRLKKS